MSPRIVLLVVLCGCSRTAPPSLTVIAAASLTDAFGALQTQFEARNAVEVKLSVAGSQTLATQVRHGLIADVFASADALHVDGLVAEGHAIGGRPFASNRLVVASPAGAPLSLPQLSTAQRIVMGDSEVPVGRYGTALLDEAQRHYGDDWRQQVEAHIVSREASVRLVVSKVALAEADAAIVYATDTAGLPGVIGTEVPFGPVVMYHHAALVRAPQPQLAEQWMTLVESPEGQATLAEFGFSGLP